MNLNKYTELIHQLPTSGRHINAFLQGENIVVYQAYRKSIGEFAAREQYLGGPDYSLNRMSWIKTSFLWMMYRCGWAQKEGQEIVLAITIPNVFFDQILRSTVISSFSTEFYKNKEEWRNEMDRSEARLQWDPDHDPFGNPVQRKAIQLGLKGSLLREFATNSIVKIENITPFVKDQYEKVKGGNLSELLVPTESIYYPDNALADRIKLTTVI